MDIVTIICGYENADVIPYVARVPLAISNAVIFVDGIRPIIRRKKPRVGWREYADVPYSKDDTEQVCRDLGIDYFTPKRPLWNGEKINIGKMILKTRVKFDLFLYLESDEAIEPEDTDLLMSYLEAYKEYGFKDAFVKFQVLELWMRKQAFAGTFSSSKFVMNPTFEFPIADEGHNVNYYTVHGQEEPGYIPIYFASSVRLYHLHHFRTNATQRIFDGVFHDGDYQAEIQDISFPLEETPLITEIYENLEIKDSNMTKEDPTNTYLGKVEK